MKITAIHDGSGCGYYRILTPLGELAKHGHDVTLLTAGATQRLDGGEIIVAQRFSKHEFLSQWRRLAARHRLVYENDDDVFSVDPVNWMAYSTFRNPVTRDAIAHQIEVAHLATVTTQPLADVTRQWQPDVAVLPNFIPSWVLDLPAPAGDRPAVGWQGGASHGADVQLIARPLRQFLDRHPGWDAVLIGTDYRPTIRHRRVGFIPWTHIVDDPEGYYRSVDFDIGLAPLQPTVFNRSKSHIKALEYAARGIPVIASDAEPYRDFILHGVTGYLVRYDHEWLRYLTMLADDEAMRREMGAKAKEHARSWTIEGNWHLWESAYEGILR